MSYSAKAVTNEFLGIAENESTSLTHMKVQKLVFFAHGWHLALAEDRLIDEQVECWQYGPVVRSLFSEFREFGRDPITRRATRIRVGSEDDNVRVETPTLESTARGNVDVDYSRDLIEYVWSVYGGYSAIQLSNMTHQPGTPWKRVYDEWNGHPPRGTDIPTEYIREYFLELYEDRSDDE